MGLRQREPRKSALPMSRDFAWIEVARPAGLEPATPGLEGRCSIQMSYGRTVPNDLPELRTGEKSRPQSRASEAHPKADA